jgi:hypothetical protein
MGFRLHDLAAEDGQMVIARDQPDARSQIRGLEAGQNPRRERAADASRIDPKLRIGARISSRGNAMGCGEGSV